MDTSGIRCLQLCGYARQDDRGRIAAAEIKALKKGKEESKADAVIGLHENNVPNDLIAKSLKIPIEKVEEIIKEHEKKA